VLAVKALDNAPGSGLEENGQCGKAAGNHHWEENK
jgi:hypothetical protein